MGIVRGIKVQKSNWVGRDSKVRKGNMAKETEWTKAEE
mgnify:CR=1 FL=1